MADLREVDSLAFWDCARECHYELSIADGDRIISIEVLPEAGSKIPKLFYRFDSDNAPSLVQVMLRLEFFLAGPFLNAVRQRPPNPDPETAPHVQQRKIRRGDAVVTQTATSRKPCNGC